MMNLRLTTDDRASAPAPIPFPGRRERHAGARAGSRGLSAGPGRFAALESPPTVSAEVDSAIERVQQNLDALFEMTDEWGEAAENPLPMKQWRWDPDDGPRAA